MVPGYLPAQDLAAARRRIDDTGLSGRARLETATVDALDDRPDHDACIVSLMLHFIADDGGKAPFSRASAAGCALTQGAC